MRSTLALLLLSAACQPPSAPASATGPAGLVASTPAEHTDACNHDIPDCEAACALRETNRTEHLEWFDRRCAAVVLGKNPDKAVGYTAPVLVELPVASATAGSDVPAPPASAAGSAVPLPSTRQLPPAPPLDPFADRGGASDPVECKAARSMRAKGKTREADVLAALCAAKGGAEAADPRDPSGRF